MVTERSLNRGNILMLFFVCLCFVLAKIAPRMFVSKELEGNNWKPQLRSWVLVDECLSLPLEAALGLYQGRASLKKERDKSGGSLSSEKRGHYMWRTVSA